MEQIDTIENGPAVHCNVYNYCAGRPEGIHCWEIARSKGDFHYVFNVCSDCIVYLFEKNVTLISRKDIKQILRNRKHS